MKSAHLKATPSVLALTVTPVHTHPTGGGWCWLCVHKEYLGPVVQFVSNTAKERRAR